MTWVLAVLAAAMLAPQTRDLRGMEVAWRDVSVDGPSQGQDARAERTAILRQRAQARFDAEARAFTVAELAEIEARYSSAFGSDVLDGRTFPRRPEADGIFQDLVRQYPQSNRAGCALVVLAQLSTAARREEFLRQAIAHEHDAWFENGVQVGAIARAMLAIHLAGLGRFDEAEKLASELVERFPGAWVVALSGIRCESP